MLTMSDGAKIQATISGAGRPLVFVHGWAMNGDLFNSQRRILDDRFQVVTFDLRGHGRSVASEPPTIEMLGRDLITLFDRLDLDDALLIGWSMGAMVAWEALSDKAFARRVAGLAVLDMSPRISNDATWSLGLSDGRRPLSTVKAVEAMIADWPGMVRKFVPRIFAADVSLSLHPLIARITDETIGQSAEVMAGLWESMAVQDFRKAIGEIATPMLVAYGAKSQLYKPATARFIAGKAPAAEIAAFRNSGHAPHLEEPEEFEMALLRFIERLERANGNHAPSVATAS